MWFRYLPPVFDPLGPLKYRFLLKCEALNIPPDHRPDFGLPEIPVPARTEVKLPAFVPPPFDVMTDSAETWRKRAEQGWVKYCKNRLEKVRNRVDAMAKIGMLVRQKQVRQNGRASPMELRLEWAARHYCQRWSYGKIHRQCNPKSKYSVVAIRKAIQALLKQLKLVPTLIMPSRQFLGNNRVSVLNPNGNRLNSVI